MKTKMKVPGLRIAAATLWLAAATAVYCQASTATNSTVAPTNTVSTNAVAKSKPFVHLDGTDLTIGNLPPVTFHGFASQGFIATSSYNFLGQNTTSGSIDYDEVGLNASASPFARTRIAAQVFAFDVGNVGYNQPTLDYALIDYTFNDEVGVRLGRIRRPEGIYNHIQDVDLARTSILLPQGVYDARWRDFSSSLDGGSVYGNINLPKAGSVSYEFYGGVIDLSQDGGVARDLENSLYGTGLTLQGQRSGPQIGGQLWWNTALTGLRLGAAATYNYGYVATAEESTMYPVGGGHYTPLNVELNDRINVPWHHYSIEYQHDKWTLQSEFRSQTLIEKQTTSTVFSQIPSHDSTSVANHMNTSGSWYIGAAYEVNPWMQVGTYYNEYYSSLNQLRGPPTGFQKDLALSFRFDPKPWWVLKLEGHYIHGTALLDDTLDNPNQSGNGWWLLAMKTTFSF